MWFFDYISDGFEWIGDKFVDIAETIDGVPFIGAYLAYPFLLIGNKFNTVSDSFTDASAWADETIDAYNRLPDWNDLELWLKSIWEAFGKTTVEFVEWIASEAEEKWGVLTSTAAEFVEWIASEAEAKWEVLTSTIQEIVDTVIEALPPIPSKDDIIEWVAEKFEVILDGVFMEEAE